MRNSPLLDNDKELYFIAIIPPEPISSELFKLKIFISNNFGGKAALKSPSHITIFPPFVFKIKRKQDLIVSLSKLSSNTNSFPVKLIGFNKFDQRVFFVNVQENKNLLSLHLDIKEKLQKEFGLFIDRYGGKAFHPHLTLAFKDFPKKEFSNLERYFSDKKLEKEFLCDRFFLLKHNGKNWVEDVEFTLADNFQF